MLLKVIQDILKKLIQMFTDSKYKYTQSLEPISVMSQATQLRVSTAN